MSTIPERSDPVVTREMAVRLAYVYYAERMQFAGWNELGDDGREPLIERAMVDLQYIVAGKSSALDTESKPPPWSIVRNAALAALATPDQCAEAARILRSRGSESAFPADVIEAAIVDLKKQERAGRIATTVIIDGIRLR